MLRQVFIAKDGTVLYKRNFGKALDEENFAQALKQLQKEAFKINTEQIKWHDFFKYRINYLSLPPQKMLFMFVSDLSDDFKGIQKELTRCKKEFMSLFGMMLDDDLDHETMEMFNPTMDLIHKNLRPKISLIGFSGVGKTTITRLITAEDIPHEHVPTITGDIGTIKIGKLHFHLWDFAGQEQFSFLWNNFIKGSDAVLLITDSTLENCEKSKYFTELIRKEAPYAHSAVIGNKQDLPDAMPLNDIERILEMKAYSMIAVDPDNRNKMITIIADILEMSGEVSPLLKPLLRRDKILLEAEEAVNNGQFDKALKMFEELADLSLDLGDDRVSQEFLEKADKIRGLVEKMEAEKPKEPEPAPEPAPAPEPPAKEPAPEPIATPEPPAQPTEKPTTPEPPVSAQPKETPPAPPMQKPTVRPPAPPVAKEPKELPITPQPPVQQPTTAPPVQEPSATPPVQQPTVAPPVQQPSVAPPVQPSVAPPAPPVMKQPDYQAPPTTPQVAPPVQTPEQVTPPPQPATPQPEPTLAEAPAAPAQEDKLGALLNKLKTQKPAPAQPAAPENQSVLGKASNYAVTETQPPASTQPTAPPAQPTVTQPQPVSPTPAPVTPAPVTPAPVAQAPARATSGNADSDKLIKEIKIKIAKLNQKILDLEMDNITGDLSDEDFATMTKKLEGLKARMLKQIEELKYI